MRSLERRRETLSTTTRVHVQPGGAYIAATNLCHPTEIRQRRLVQLCKGMQHIPGWTGHDDLGNYPSAFPLRTNSGD